MSDASMTAAAWQVHSEWLPLPGCTWPERITTVYQDQRDAERDALHVACCAGARYVSVQSPGAVVTLEWDRYTNRARYYRPQAARHG